MQGFVQDAIEREEAEQRDADDDDSFGDPRIVIVGAGGAGNNTVKQHL